MYIALYIYVQLKQYITLKLMPRLYFPLCLALLLFINTEHKDNMVVML